MCGESEIFACSKLEPQLGYAVGFSGFKDPQHSHNDIQIRDCVRQRIRQCSMRMAAQYANNETVLHVNVYVSEKTHMLGWNLCVDLRVCGMGDK